jgi:hypothetical protein
VTSEQQNEKEPEEEEDEDAVARDIYSLNIGICYAKDHNNNLSSDIWTDKRLKWKLYWKIK